MPAPKKRNKLSLPPTAPVIEDMAMRAMIEKGGAVASNGKAAVTAPIDEDKLKSFTFKIYESELSKIREIQDRMPKRDRVSIHDFVLAAVQEKIKKQY